MNNEEKKYLVFVSSTLSDLREERQEVMQALLELDCIPSGMELFQASNQDQWELIKEVIDESDYYIVIIGGRYGTMGIEDKSYTQMEYEYAESQGKPILGFIIEDTVKLTVDKVDGDQTKKQLLKIFIELVMQKPVRKWHSAADLGSKVSRSLINEIKRNPQIGWIRGDTQSNIKDKQEIIRLQHELTKSAKLITQMKTQSEIVLADYARGEDIYEITNIISVSPEFKYRFDGEGKSSLEPVKSVLKIKMTWDNIFLLNSRELLHEASETEMAKYLQSYISEGYKTIISKLLNKEHPDVNWKQYDGFVIGITVNTMDQIITQFLALRLIEKGQIQRPAKDKKKYWKLTEKGEDSMLRIGAIKRKAPDSND